MTTNVHFCCKGYVRFGCLKLVQYLNITITGFGKRQSKCKECRVVSHLKCQGSVPQTCGLPAELMEHFTKALNTPLSPEPARKYKARDS